jgi:hypothetical protein
MKLQCWHDGHGLVEGLGGLDIVAVRIMVGLLLLLQFLLFVEGVFWLNFGVLIGCARNLAKNPKKVSFHAQNQQKSHPMRVGSVACTETGQNEVSKQTTEEVQGALPGLLLFEKQKNSWSTISWSAVQKSKNAHVSSGQMYIIVDQNGLISWFWCTNFSFLSL